jgi:hypothetical protein
MSDAAPDVDQRRAHEADRAEDGSDDRGHGKYDRARHPEDDSDHTEQRSSDRIAGSGENPHGEIIRCGRPLVHPG